MKKLVMIVAVLAATAMAGTANAAVGISLELNDRFTPAVGINFQPSGWVIDVLAQFESVDTDHTAFGAGVRLDKLMDATADISGLWGLCADVLMTSPDADNADSYTDFGVGAYIGGNAHIGSPNFHLVGHCGVKVNLEGKRFENDESATNFGTFANLMFRWTGVLGK